MVVLDLDNVGEENIKVKTPLRRRNIETGLDFDVLFPNRRTKSKTTNLNQPPKIFFRDHKLYKTRHKSLYFFVNIFQDRTRVKGEG